MQPSLENTYGGPAHIHRHTDILRPVRWTYSGHNIVILPDCWLLRGWVLNYFEAAYSFL